MNICTTLESQILPPDYLYEHNVLGEALNWFEQQPLKTQTSVALSVLLFQEINQLHFLLEPFFQYANGSCEVVNVGRVATNHSLCSQLQRKEDTRENELV